MAEVITRFAPSPTGALHIGGARTALFCWALARGAGGRFLLRIEDTDRDRSSEGAAHGILEDLAWIGLAWDEGPEWWGPRLGSGGEARRQRPIGGDPRKIGPFHQADRLKIYDRHVQRLIDQGDAYQAFETPEELDAARRAAQAAKATYRYDRAALRLSLDERARRAQAGEPHVVRLKMPDEDIDVHDEVLGDVRFEAENLDDFIIRKRDGYPTYHLAVVVDDELMGVTHVLRGQEHLINTPRHVALQRALGFRTPVYAHLPLIFNPDGSKMSKRDKNKAARLACREAAARGAALDPATASMDRERFESWLADSKSQLELDVIARIARELNLHLPEIDVADFRASGYLPEVLCNYLALLGWNPGERDEAGGEIERFDLAFLAEHFSLDRLGKKPSRFDRDKLLAFNADTIQKDLTDEQFLARWRGWAGRYDMPLAAVLRSDRGPLLAAAARPRARTLADAAEPVRFALIDDEAVVYDDKAVQKVLLKGEPNGLERLGQIAPVIQGVRRFEPEAVEGAIKAWCESNEVGMGKIAQPLRVAVTGTSVSPGLGDTLVLVGKKGVQRRIERCLAVAGGAPDDPGP